jgi:hypothetical protein
MTTRAHFWLRRLLRVNGGLMILAMVAVVLPHSAMDAIHRGLGLGQLPDIPIVGYLTRSLSAIYALLGVTAMYLAADLPRYRPLIRFWSAVTIVFGLTMLGIDLAAQLPAWWTLGEGGFVTGMGGVLLGLSRGRDET